MCRQRISSNSQRSPPTHAIQITHLDAEQGVTVQLSSSLLLAQEVLDTDREPQHLALLLHTSAALVHDSHPGTREGETADWPIVTLALVSRRPSRFAYERLRDWFEHRSSRFVGLLQSLLPRPCLRSPLSFRQALDLPSSTFGPAFVKLWTCLRDHQLAVFGS